MLEAPAEAALKAPRSLLTALEFSALFLTPTLSTLLGLGAHGHQYGDRNQQAHDAPRSGLHEHCYCGLAGTLIQASAHVGTFG